MADRLWGPAAFELGPSGHACIVSGYNDLTDPQQLQDASTLRLIDPSGSELWAYEAPDLIALCYFLESGIMIGWESNAGMELGLFAFDSPEVVWSSEFEATASVVGERDGVVYIRDGSMVYGFDDLGQNVVSVDLDTLSDLGSDAIEGVSLVEDRIYVADVWSVYMLDAETGALIATIDEHEVGDEIEDIWGIDNERFLIVSINLLHRDVRAIRWWPE